jgi:hypothetical protein
MTVGLRWLMSKARRKARKTKIFSGFLDFWFSLRLCVLFGDQ